MAGCTEGLEKLESQDRQGSKASLDRSWLSTAHMGTEVWKGLGLGLMGYGTQV